MRDGRPIPEEYQQKITEYLQVYDAQLYDAREDLETVFRGDMQKPFSQEGVLAYLAWKCLEIDPKKRMSAKDGVKTLSSFRDTAAIAIMSLT